VNKIGITVYISITGSEHTNSLSNGTSSWARVPPELASSILLQKLTLEGFCWMFPRCPFHTALDAELSSRLALAVPY